VVEFRTDSSEKVFPMVAAGASNSDVQVPPFQVPPVPAQPSRS